MASPQIENGHTRIANELLDALLRVKLNRTQLAICLAVIRKTYGWHRLADHISFSQIAAMIRTNRRTVIKEFKKLVEWQMIRVVSPSRGRRPAAVAFQKDYDLWTSDLQDTSPDATGDQLDTHTGDLQDTHKRKERKGIKTRNGKFARRVRQLRRSQQWD